MLHRLSGVTLFDLELPDQGDNRIAFGSDTNSITVKTAGNVVDGGANPAQSDYNDYRNQLPRSVSSMSQIRPGSSNDSRHVGYSYDASLVNNTARLSSNMNTDENHIRQSMQRYLRPDSTINGDVINQYVVPTDMSGTTDSTSIDLQQEIEAISYSSKLIYDAATMLLDNISRELDVVAKASERR
ncbi:MAG: hypothetical protein QG673_992 [Pseudomonadota bacterium]|nr:hypothetical protein [Pseudomonadota bacterium]